jgi:twitching motility protein PilT
VHAGQEEEMDIFKLLAIAKSKNASDLHLSVYSPPLMRISGSLERANGLSPLTEAEVREAFSQIATRDEMEEFHRELELDFGYTLPDGTRLRCNAAQQRGVTSLAVRILPPRIPTIDELELPEMCKKLVLMERGLIVISGPTGSGKTTTQAAMIRYLNATRTRHVVTIEDPIEYSHPNINSTITQRELGGDTFSFAQSLKHVLRHDPDVILVGEMRDTETAAAVISLAETGHLVITTGHAPYAPQAVQRIIDLFPFQERHLAQMRLASLLTAVLCQTLVPRADGSGRIAAIEIMLVNSAVSSLIHEGKINQLNNAIRTYRQMGMITLDEALIELHSRGIITSETILDYCHAPDDVSKLLYQPRTEEESFMSRLTAKKNGEKAVACAGLTISSEIIR